MCVSRGKIFHLYTSVSRIYGACAGLRMRNCVLITRCVHVHAELTRQRRPRSCSRELELKMRGDSAISSKVSQCQLVVKTQEYYCVTIRLRARYCTYHAMCTYPHQNRRQRRPRSCAGAGKEGLKRHLKQGKPMAASCRNLGVQFVMIRLLTCPCKALCVKPLALTVKATIIVLYRLYLQSRNNVECMRATLKYFRHLEKILQHMTFTVSAGNYHLCQKLPSVIKRQEESCYCKSRLSAVVYGWCIRSCKYIVFLTVLQQ